jgi:hypothetical protein
MAKNLTCSVSINYPQRQGKIFCKKGIAVCLHDLREFPHFFVFPSGRFLFGWVFLDSLTYGFLRWCQKKTTSDAK